MSTESNIRGALKRWILSYGESGLDDIDDATRIFGDEVLKSIHIMELILFIEELGDCPVEIDELRPGSFASIDAIYETFFRKKEALT